LEEEIVRLWFEASQAKKLVRLYFKEQTKYHDRCFETQLCRGVNRRIMASLRKKYEILPENTGKAKKGWGWA
jgi:hypothetical protein